MTDQDQEIIRRVAVEVMGWEFILSSPNNEQPNDYDIYILKRNNKGEVEKVIYCYEWRPLTNANHTMKVAKRMRELGWYLNMQGSDEDWRTFFFHQKKDMFGPIIHHIAFGHAVCLAALKAVEEGK